MRCPPGLLPHPAPLGTMPCSLLLMLRKQLLLPPCLDRQMASQARLLSCSSRALRSRRRCRLRLCHLSQMALQSRRVFRLTALLAAAMLSQGLMGRS